MQSGSQWLIQVFQMSSFHLRNSILIIGNKYYKLFSLNFPFKITLLIFGKMSVKYSTLSSHSLSVVFSSKNSIPWKKQLGQLATQTIPQELYLKNHHTLNMQAHELYAYSLRITQNIKETFIQELRVNKTDFLVVKMFLSETFFNCKNDC